MTETFTLIPTVNPSNAPDKSVVWSSNDESVASVSNGLVSAKKVGTAIITAKTVNNLVDQCTVTVTPKELTGAATTLNGNEATSYTVKSTSEYKVTAKNAEGTKTENYDVTEADITKVLDYSTNIDSEYTRWMNTELYERSAAGITAEISGDGATKTVTISESGTRYDGVYTVMLSKISDSQYSMSCIRHATSANRIFDITVGADMVTVKSTRNGALFTATAKKDKSYAKLYRDDVLIAEMTKINEEYKFVISNTYINKYDVKVEIVKD